MSAAESPPPHFTTRVPVRALWVVAIALVALHVVAVTIWFGDLVDQEATGLRCWHISIFALDEEESFGT